MERDFLGAIDRAWKCGEAAKEESRSEPDSPAATRWQFAARSGVAPAFMSFRTEATGEGSEAFSVSELRPAGDAFDGIKKQSSMLSIYQQQANLMVRSSVSQSFHNQQQPFTMSNNGFGGSTAGVYGARNPRNQASTQLTIFYNGSVNVFDNVPVDKAKELMMLASRASVPGATPSSEPDSPPVPAPAPAKVNVAEVFPGARQIAVQKPEPCVPHLSSAATASPVRIVVPQAVAPSRSTSHCATEACAVPQARKASLARFLEKRKERVASVEPYLTSNSKSPLESSDAVGSASAPTKSSSTDVAPASSHNGGGAELVRHGGYPRSISFSTNLQI
ncbi:Protein TIFY 6a [Zea mays]|uniref:Protein TIFY n=1 Tax=Zea mays TaxID=4577 RepID=A0A3L6F7D3_MAIZE|nr:Protein TIFY 6a [Zea mays]